MAPTRIPGIGSSQPVAVSLLRNGPWASLTTETVERLAAGGTLSDISAGATVYTEAEAERFAVVVRGLLRVYMHTSDGRQVTVRYVRAGGLLGAPALVGGPAPVFVQALTDSAMYFMDVAHVKRLVRADAAVAWVFAEESVHRLDDVLERRHHRGHYAHLLKEDLVAASQQVKVRKRRKDRTMAREVCAPAIPVDV